MDNHQEIFPLVDENGIVIGSATRGECHSGSRLLHPVVHLHVFDSKRERELVYVNRTTYNGEIHPSAEELDGGAMGS